MAQLLPIPLGGDRSGANNTVGNTTTTATPDAKREQAIASIVSSVLKGFGVDGEAAKGIGTIVSQYVNGEISRAEAEAKMNKTQTDAGLGTQVASNNTQDILNQVEA